MSSAAFRAYDGAQDFNAWPAPDTSILTGRREPPPFPAELLPAELWGLVVDLAEGASAPVDYVAATLLSASASLIGGTRRGAPFRGQKWTEPCILWTGLVGDPSSNKSPGLDAGVDPMARLEELLADGHEDALRTFAADDLRAKAEREAWEKAVQDSLKNGGGTCDMPKEAVAPERPQRPRLMMMDVTPERACSILAHNTRGVLMKRDELAGWFQSFDKYTSGGRPYWIEAFGGRPYTVDRQKDDGKLLRVPFNGVSVIGGIQPDKLASAVLQGDDDGLAARFLWVWPRSIPLKRPRTLADSDLHRRVFERLLDLRFATDEEGRERPITLPFDDAAADMFDDWRQTNAAGIHDGGPLYRGFVGKLPGITIRLSLVVELLTWALRGGREPDAISSDTVDRVCGFVETYAKPMALRVFGDAALPDEQRKAMALAKHIVVNRLSSFNAKRLRIGTGCPSGLREPKAMDDALAVLVDLDWLRPDGARAGPTAGRAPKDYTVNPAIKEIDRDALV